MCACMPQFHHRWKRYWRAGKRIKRKRLRTDRNTEKEKRRGRAERGAAAQRADRSRLQSVTSSRKDYRHSSLLVCCLFPLHFICCLVFPLILSAALPTFFINFPLPCPRPLLPLSFPSASCRRVIRICMLQLWRCWQTEKSQMELSLCAPVWFIELHLSLAMLQKPPESEMCDWWCVCVCVNNLCLLVFECVLVQAECACCSPVLSEGSQVGDLQRVGVWLVVFLVHNSPRLLFSIVLHHLAEKVCCNSSPPAVSNTDHRCARATQTRTHLSFNYPLWYGCFAIRTRAKAKCCCSRADVADD